MNGDSFPVCVESISSGLILTNGSLFARLSFWMPLKLCVVEQSDAQLCCLVEDEQMQCFLKWSLLPPPQIFWYCHFGKPSKDSKLTRKQLWKFDLKLEK